MSGRSIRLRFPRGRTRTPDLGYTVVTWVVGPYDEGPPGTGFGTLVGVIENIRSSDSVRVQSDSTDVDFFDVPLM